MKIIQIAINNGQILGLTEEGDLMIWNTNMLDWMEYKDA